MKKIFSVIAFICFSYTITLAQNITKIDSLLNASIEQGLIPHANIIALKGNSVSLKKSYGYKDINKKEELQLNHIFRLSSLTKLITSVAVMKLVDQGKISLNDPIEKFIKDFLDLRILDSINSETGVYITLKANKGITIQNLLANTSGIAYGAAMCPTLGLIYNKNGIDMGYDTSSVNLKEKISTLAKLPILHEPGTQWTYGFNYDVLGYIIEIVSGQKYDDFLNENVFKPLHMNNTFFYLDEENAKKLVPIHLYNRTEETYYSTTETPDLPFKMPFCYPTCGSKQYLSGGVGINSTITDYMHILEMLYNDGNYNNKQFLTTSSAQSITSNQIGDLPFMLKGSSWGFGNIVEKDKRIFWSEGGGFSYFKVNKDDDYILLLFTQTMFTPHSIMKLFFQLDQEM